MVWFVKVDMRFPSLFIVFSCFLLLAPQFAGSMDLDINEGRDEAEEAVLVAQEDLHQIFSHIISKDISWDGGEVKISSFFSQPQDISLPPGKLGYRLLSLSPERYPGKKYASVMLTVDGRDTAKIKMNGDVQFFGDVVCRPWPPTTPCWPAPWSIVSRTAR